MEFTLATLEPNKLCEYVYELCGKFTTFYQNCQVVEAGVVNASRLLLVRAVQQVLKKGNELLGIGYLEKV